MEEWGTGIRRILKRAEEYGLQKPEFLEIGDTFRVNLYRKADKKPIKKADKKPIKDERKKLIFAYIEQEGSISNKEAREILGLAESTTKRILKQLVEEGELQERGERRNRRYCK